MSASGLDDLLVDTLGEFGRGQVVLLLVAGLGWASLATQIFISSFQAIDPLGNGWWACASTGNACVAAAHVCRLPPGELVWTQPQRSVVSQFNLICGQSWKVRRARGTRGGARVQAGSWLVGRAASPAGARALSRRASGGHACMQAGRQSGVA